MKNSDWAKWSAIAEILSAVAIVITVVYLAFQTRYLAVQTEQNNDLLQLQKSLSSLQVMLSVTGPVGENADLRRAVDQLRAGQELTLSDAQMIRSQLSRVILTMEWQYKELPAERERIRSSFVDIWKNVSLVQALWDDLQSQLDTEFVAFVNASLPDRQ